MAGGRSLADRIRATAGSRHAASYYRVLSTASWSLEEVGQRLLRMLVRWAPAETLFLVGDDTLLPRKGSQIFGAGVHRDACLSTRNRAVKRWGHSWVLLSVLLESRRHPGRYYSLPVMVRLYMNERVCQKLRRKYRKKSDLMIEMLEQVQRQLPGQKLHFLGDYGNTAPAILQRIPRGIEVTGRARSDARLFAPAPPRTGSRGRPRVRGEQLPSPAELLQGRAQRREFEVAPGRHYRVRAASITGCFFQAPDRLVRMVALEHLSGRRENDVFYTTVTAATVEQVVQWYARRWSIEVTIRDCKQHLGVGREQNRTRGAARRTAAVGFLMYSVIVWWYEAARPEPVIGLRDYPDKRHASFADMLAALRRDTLAEDRRNIIRRSPTLEDAQKIQDYLEKLLLLAA